MRVLIVGGGPVDLDQLQWELAQEPDLIIAADAVENTCMISAFPTS